MGAVNLPSGGCAVSAPEQRVRFSFICPACGQSLEAEESDYGVQIECPTCKQPIQVPTPTVATKTCPLCSMEILATAVKCRFCGEFLEERPKAIATAPVPTPAPKQAKEGCFLQTLNVGCVIAVVLTVALFLAIGSCFNSCDGIARKTTASEQTTTNVERATIEARSNETPYEVLRRNVGSGNSVNMDVLVDEKALQQDVLNLAQPRSLTPRQASASNPTSTQLNLR